MDFQIDTLTALVVLGAGALIRPVTAFLTKAQADTGPVGIICGVVLAGVTTAGAALADVGNIATDWKNVVVAFGATIVTAGAAAAQTWAGKAVEWIHAKTDAWITSFLGKA